MIARKSDHSSQECSRTYTRARKQFHIAGKNVSWAILISLYTLLQSQKAKIYRASVQQHVFQAPRRCRLNHPVTFEFGVVVPEPPLSEHLSALLNHKLAGYCALSFAHVYAGVTTLDGKKRGIKPGKI